MKIQQQKLTYKNMIKKNYIVFKKTFKFAAILWAKR